MLLLSDWEQHFLDALTRKHSAPRFIFITDPALTCTVREQAAATSTAL